MPLFDSYLMVDWSAASKSNKDDDSIWLALYRRKSGLKYRKNLFTRDVAVKEIANLLHKEAKECGRVLAGFDFAFGYPKGFAKEVTGKTSALGFWRWLGKEIYDNTKNENNRFEVAAKLNSKHNRKFGGGGPFWGRHHAWTECLVPMRKEGITYGKIKEYRNTERHIKKTVQSSPKSVWQLFYNGSVGSQILVGLPALQKLRNDKRLEKRIKVWPFETGLKEPKAKVVLAEIYPSLLEKAVNEQQAHYETKDSAQVCIMAKAFAKLDAKDKLNPLFNGPKCLKSDACLCRTVVEEEGWILGGGYERSLQKAAES